MARSPSTMTGMMTAGIHAPSVNFETTTTSATTPVEAADAVDHRVGAPVRLLEAEVVPHHSGLAQREPGEHAERIGISA